MKILILSLVLLSLLISPTLSTFGADVSSPVSVGEWQCLHSQGYDFAIVRAYESGGSLDYNSAATIRNAHQAGIPYVDAYLFPCFSCGNPAGQVTSTIDYLYTSAAGIGMLWFDIEIYQWSSDQAANQNFIKGLVDQGKTYTGIKVGIYSSYYNWESIVGLAWDYPQQMGLPIWYAHYDNNPSYSDFVGFGGWGSPSIKQFAGNVNVCGVNIDKNFY